MCPIVFVSSLRLKDPLELVQSRDFIVIHIPSMIILKEFSLVRDVVFIILSLSLFLSSHTHANNYSFF
jgi:hypothetical protein